MSNIIGIRREDPDKRGEQRTALTPKEAANLTSDGIRVIVQPAKNPETGEMKRAFPDEEYEDAACEISESLDEADVIIGLKEVGVEHLQAGKPYFMFSHTHKGQVKNRKLLRAMVERNCSLIDYELIEDDSGNRILTAFTYYAGYAGMVDSIWAYGKRMKQKGIDHPFQNIPQSIKGAPMENVKRLLKECGKTIEEKGTPAQLPPLITVILGKGKTSSGSQTMFDILPVKQISLSELKDTYEQGSRKQVYKLVLDIHEMFRLKDPYQGEGLSVEEFEELYFSDPDKFESNLDVILPYTSILMNCILWSPEFPRTMPKDLTEEIWRKSGLPEVIGDITCDPNGSIEFSKETWIDDPVFIYNPKERKSTSGFEGEGICVMAVTNLPCEFSADASRQFASELLPYLHGIARANFNSPLTESGLPDSIHRATILWQGTFTPEFEYMKEFLE